jgi:hypothetical protein
MLVLSVMIGWSGEGDLYILPRWLYHEYISISSYGFNVHIYHEFDGSSTRGQSGCRITH